MLYCTFGHLPQSVSYALLYCWTSPGFLILCFILLLDISRKPWHMFCYIVEHLMFHPQLLFLFSVFLLFCLRSQACQGVLYVMLGSAFNINKSKDQRAANVWNNVVLAMGIVTTILNVIISAFDMRETDMMGFNSTTTPSPSSQ